MDKQIKSAIKKSIKNSKYSVPQICERMSKNRGEVTPNMLYNYSAKSHSHMIPASMIPAFCLATERYDVIEELIAPIETIRIIKKEEALLLEIFKNKQLQSKLDIKEKELWKQIKEQHEQIVSPKQTVGIFKTIKNFLNALLEVREA